ncbi:hypothetical protein SAMN04489725_12044 [Alicyclobacillus hesperidum]|uniref:Uncharacterized protein n=1 Tax=Alicyclobacillus hesperidum TaxID=89784 RepID=A0A1H2XGH9_9BACL|nr:hypothetical protein SAMN04489725_12044 [Alicyclobacillus hesperidum]
MLGVSERKVFTSKIGEMMGEAMISPTLIQPFVVD